MANINALLVFAAVMDHCGACAFRIPAACAGRSGKSRSTGEFLFPLFAVANKECSIGIRPIRTGFAARYEIDGQLLHLRPALVSRVLFRCTHDTANLVVIYMAGL